MGNTATTLGD